MDSKIRTVPDTRTYLAQALWKVAPPERRDFLVGQMNNVAEVPFHRELFARLLALDPGSAVCVPWPERDAQTIVEHGRVFTEAVRHVKGRVNACHENSMKLFAKNPLRYQLCTGYFLSAGDPGVWRSHSWAFDLKKQMIVETTPITAVIYFGVAYSRELVATLVAKAA